MRPDYVGLGGFDSHAFPPRARSLVLALLLAVHPCASFAQSDAATPKINAKPPISPARAFLASSLAPGLGQSVLGRGSGFIFITVEAIGLTMYGKSKHDLAVARGFARDSTPLSYVIDPATGVAERDSTGALRVATWSTTSYGGERIRARKTHVEDWVAVLIFNHLFAGIDAYVAAHLWQLPAQVEMRASPGGTTTIRANIRW